MPLNRNRKMMLLLICSALMVAGCATKSEGYLPTKEPSIPALASEARQSKTLSICSPSCEQKLMNTQQRLQQVVGLDSPASGPTTP